MKVKASVFITLIKTIKSDKSGVYDKYLTDQDREVINQKILISTWCPFETYINCINAVYEVIAKKNPKVAKEWGISECQTAMTSTYSALISNRNPLDFLKKYEVVHKAFYDFGKIEINVEGENQAVLKFNNFDVKCVPFFYIIEGWVERCIELCGAKNVKSEFLRKSWEGDPSTSMRLTWSE